jgi:hypothetical protein
MFASPSSLSWLRSALIGLCVLLLISGAVSLGISQTNPDQPKSVILRPPSQNMAAKVASRKAAGASHLTALSSKAQKLRPNPQDYPVVVYPAGLGFLNLQDALDFCGRARNSAAMNTVMLDEGIFVGNFVLPASGVEVIGRYGREATFLQGAPGAGLPTLSFSPSGGASGGVSASLIGLSILGVDGAAIHMGGNNADAELNITQCGLEAPATFAAVHLAGNGFGQDQEMALFLMDSMVESAGGGISANVGPYTRLFVFRSFIQCAEIGIEMNAGALPGTELILYQTPVEGSNALVASNIDFIWSGGSILDGAQTCVDLSGVTEAGLERAEVHSENGDGIRISNTVLYARYLQISPDAAGKIGISAINSSQINADYCEIHSDLISDALQADASSTIFSIYNHWRFTPL